MPYKDIWRIGGGFYQKKKRKATTIYLSLFNSFTKSVAEIYYAFDKLDFIEIDFPFLISCILPGNHTYQLFLLLSNDILSGAH